MRIFVKRENWEDGIWMRLPATEEEAEQIRRSLEEQHPSVMLPFIGAVDSRFPELEQRLVGELVYQEEKLNHLNQLAERLGSLNGEEEMHVPGGIPAGSSLYSGADPGDTGASGPLPAPSGRSLTIHNIEYQGRYGRDLLTDLFGLPGGYFHERMLSYYGDINLMKGGIYAADYVTTVSPTYAQEIMDPWFAHKLDPILRERSWKVSGILNGIDTVNYDPEKDPALYANYTREDKKEQGGQ